MSLRDPVLLRAWRLARLREKAAPGPWRALTEPDFAYSRVTRSASFTDLLSREVYDHPHNARLMAAAPEMAELLEELASRVSSLEQRIGIARWNIAGLPCTCEQCSVADDDPCPRCAALVALGGKEGKKEAQQHE